MKNPKRDQVTVLAIIPARGGQQSIPYKNLQTLGNKTLLQWAIDVAFAATAIDAVVVSTEDSKIAEAAAAAGALVAPRPSEHSTPSSGDAGFYCHSLEWVGQEFGWQPELFVNLRPTSPLRFASDIDAMVAYMQQHPEADGLKSVIPTPLHPYKMWQLEGDGEIGTAGKLVSFFESEHKAKYGPDVPRQRLQQNFPVFFQDGQVDITRRKFLLRPECLDLQNVWGENLHGYVLDPRTSTDLDEPADFIRAEKIYRDLEQERGR
jgi:N-acylneuraminate cytidylyltransferase